MTFQDLIKEALKFWSAVIIFMIVGLVCFSAIYFVGINLFMAVKNVIQ